MLLAPKNLRIAAGWDYNDSKNIVKILLAPKNLRIAGSYAILLLYLATSTSSKLN